MLVGLACLVRYCCWADGEGERVKCEVPRGLKINGWDILGVENVGKDTSVELCDGRL